MQSPNRHHKSLSLLNKVKFISKRYHVRDFGKDIGVGVLAFCGAMVLLAVMFAFSVSITSLLVAMAWNWFNLHSLLGQPELTLEQIIGVEIVITLLRGIFSRRNC